MEEVDSQRQGIEEGMESKAGVWEEGVESQSQEWKRENHSK